LSTGAVIDTSIDYVRPSFPERGDQEHRLLFRPRAPLNDGWHVLSVDVTGLDPRVDSSAVDHPDDNSYRVRFRADSHPILTGARIQTDDDSTLIELVASERLVVGMEDVSVRAAGRDVRCEWLGPSTAASGPDGMQAHVSLRCPFELADQIEVAFASRVATWQGVPLFGDDDTAPARIAWEPQSAEPFDDALRTRVYAFDLPGPY
jgi:hypothetical protein